MANFYMKSPKLILNIHTYMPDEKIHSPFFSGTYAQSNVPSLLSTISHGYFLSPGPTTSTSKGAFPAFVASTVNSAG